MDRSEQLRQTHPPPKTGFFAALGRRLPFWEPQLVVACTIVLQLALTDTMPLTPTAKWMMSGQALAALVTVGLVVARAVNILS